MISQINYLAVIAAAAAAFAAGAIWNTVMFGDVIMRSLDPDWDATQGSRPPAWKLFAEFARCLVIAFALAWLVVRVNPAGWAGAAMLGTALWAGFPAAILSGAVLWQNEPWKLAAVHAGDWFVKLLLISMILTAWR